MGAAFNYETLFSCSVGIVRQKEVQECLIWMEDAFSLQLCHSEENLWQNRALDTKESVFFAKAAQSKKGVLSWGVKSTRKVTAGIAGERAAEPLNMWSQYHASIS